MPHRKEWIWKDTDDVEWSLLDTWDGEKYVRKAFCVRPTSVARLSNHPSYVRVDGVCLNDVATLVQFVLSGAVPTNAVRVADTGPVDAPTGPR